MNIFQSILLAVASFFGFNQSDVPPPTEPVPQEATMAAELETTTSSAVVADEAESASDDTSMAQTETAASDTPVEPEETPAASTPNITTALVAGGCFWCVEADLEKTPGVISAVSGYAGGTTENPTYDNYGSGGHREVVEVTYDANQISFEGILIVTMKTTDPTDDDGTFADRGDKYSAAFYYENDAERTTIENLIAEVNERGPYDEALAIDVEARPTFWPAEDYHQDYYKGTLSALKYSFYRNASGRDDFINQYWSEPRSPTLPWRTTASNSSTEMSEAIIGEVNDELTETKTMDWKNYQKPPKAVLKAEMDSLAFKVTQEEGTERAGTSPLDKVYEDGIYVDILSGEPLFSSRDKYDSKTGWPSFTRPITPDAVTEHEDRKLFSVRTEIRSAVADNHLGHVFTDGPPDDGGLRYCMNGVALRFIPKAEMEAAGYGDYLDSV